MTAKAPVTGKRPFRMIAGVSVLADLADGAGAGWGYPGSGYVGKQYFVNNITGSSGASGLSWDDPFDQITTAITASEAQRQLPAETTNEYVRNQIFVQGTGTTYTNLAALPNYCDIIGVGALSYGDGAGIVCIGLAGYDGIAGSARGLGLYNLQFQAPTGYYCADFVNLYRSEIAFCTFQSRVTDATAGMRFTGACSGVLVRNCAWTAGGGASWAVLGISIEGPSFTNSIFEDNHVVATNAAVYVISTCVTAGGTIFRNNNFGGTGLAWGVDDNATTGQIVYTGNHICCVAGQGGALANNGTARWVCNYSAATFSAVTAS
mgnify:FL=1